MSDADSSKRELPDAPAGTERADLPQGEAVGQIVLAGWSGPLPHPRDLEAFKGVDPEFPQRILAMAETEQRHRHAIAQANVTERLRGQAFAFFVALCFVVAGTFLVSNGHPVAGTIFGGTTLVWIVSAFLRAKAPGRETWDSEHR